MMQRAGTVLKKLVWLAAGLSLVSMACPAFSQTATLNSPGNSPGAAAYAPVKKNVLPVTKQDDPKTAASKRTPPPNAAKAGKPARATSPRIFANKSGGPAPSIFSGMDKRYSGLAVKGLGADGQPAPGASLSQLPLTPELRPAVDALVPSSSIDREPKTVERTAPGLSATLHTGADTDITGVFNLPGSNASSVRPYGQPESGSKPAASGGVMLKHSF
jgi:hypothetical protein